MEAIPINFKQLQKFYNGFYIEKAVGNNAFSFDQRRQKKLFVAPIKFSEINDLRVGSKPAFCEVEDGKEICVTGLENFLYFNYKNKPIFIFDNHNHAFFFWTEAYRQNIIPMGLPLVHVDQHSDMRQPAIKPDASILKDDEKGFKYTNFVLNVGNFIRPALQVGLFKQMELVDSSYSVKKRFSEPLVLDIDIDFFAEPLNYIPETEKIAAIAHYFALARLVTIATSPYFINQQLAIEVINKIFSQL